MFFSHAKFKTWTLACVWAGRECRPAFCIESCRQKWPGLGLSCAARLSAEILRFTTRNTIKPGGDHQSHLRRRSKISYKEWSLLPEGCLQSFVIYSHPKCETHSLSRQWLDCPFETAGDSCPPNAITSYCDHSMGQTVVPEELLDTDLYDTNQKKW